MTSLSIRNMYRSMDLRNQLIEDSIIQSNRIECRKLVEYLKPLFPSVDDWNAFVSDGPDDNAGFLEYLRAEKAQRDEAARIAAELQPQMTEFLELVGYACDDSAVCDELIDAVASTEREQAEIDEVIKWLSDTVSEPATAGASTSLAYGDAELAELAERHRDGMDLLRTQEDARY